MGDRQIISVGSFCIASGLIEAGGQSQPSYPFDDMFSDIRMVTQALGDRFAVFLDADDYIAGHSEKVWVQRRYREDYGQAETFVHHDMSLPENRAAYRRRADRLMALTETDNPLFFYIQYADRRPPADMLLDLRRALTEHFGKSHLLVVFTGEPSPGDEERADAKARGITIRYHKNEGRVGGTGFEKAEDNWAVIGMIRETLAATELPEKAAVG